MTKKRRLKKITKTVYCRIKVWVNRISFTENCKQKTENYSTNNYAGINKGEGKVEGRNLIVKYR